MKNDSLTLLVSDYVNYREPPTIERKASWLFPRKLTITKDGISFLKTNLVWAEIHLIAFIYNIESFIFKIKLFYNRFFEFNIVFNNERKKIVEFESLIDKKIVPMQHIMGDWQNTKVYQNAETTLDDYYNVKVYYKKLTGKDLQI